MKRKSTLLNVVSIIVIVFSTLGIISNLILMASSGLLETYLEPYNIPVPTAADYAFSLVLGIVELIAGIAGVMYRSKKSVLIMGVLYCLGILANIVISSISLGFSFTYAFSLILPILYMWGWYQSE